MSVNKFWSLVDLWCFKFISHLIKKMIFFLSLEEGPLLNVQIDTADSMIRFLCALLNCIGILSNPFKVI